MDWIIILGISSNYIFWNSKLITTTLWIWLKHKCSNYKAR